MAAATHDINDRKTPRHRRYRVALTQVMICRTNRPRLAGAGRTVEAYGTHTAVAVATVSVPGVFWCQVTRTIRWLRNQRRLPLNLDNNPQTEAGHPAAHSGN